MRMRNKPWAKPELEACNYFVQRPEEWKNQWKSHFAAVQPIYLELGCGKGGFAAQAAVMYRNINFLAIDIEYKMLGVARRNISRSLEENHLTADNILLTAYNIENISSIFGEQDTIDRIYINFCNPWPRNKHKKHRLTHPKQLVQYKHFLKPGGEIHFKTDDDGLFEESIAYFEESGFRLTYITRDLHQSDYQGNIMTEHEKMFSEEGIKIKLLIAELPEV